MRRGRPAARAVAAGIALAFVLALPLFFCPPAAALGPQIPGCSIEIDQGSLEAKPTSTTSDTVKFSGTVHVSFAPFSNLTRNVAIEGTVSPSTWGVSVDPASKEVTGGQADIPFNASVGVPAAELVTTAGRLTLRAWFPSGPGLQPAECFAQGNIRVAQYYGVNSDAITPVIDVETGPTGAVATVLVENLGNGRDSFRVELENRADLEVLGLLTTLPTTTTLDANQSTHITFSVNASSDVEERSYPLFIMVTGVNDATVRSDTEITVKVTQNIITKVFDPVVFIVLAVVAAGAFGSLAFVRSRRRKRRARLAKRQLDRIRRQRREEAASEEESKAKVKVKPERVTKEPPG